MKLSGQKPIVGKQKISVAAAFNQESDEEPEEMPPEAKMRMRNIGRQEMKYLMYSIVICNKLQRYTHIVRPQLIWQDKTRFFRCQKSF